MGWVLRLVETGIDGPARVIDVMDITPVGALGDMSKLGLMLSEAKQVLARLQVGVSRGGGGAGEVDLDV